MTEGVGEKENSGELFFLKERKNYRRNIEKGADSGAGSLSRAGTREGLQTL
jgi:hypothetical protein